MGSFILDVPFRSDIWVATNAATNGRLIPNAKYAPGPTFSNTILGLLYTMHLKYINFSETHQNKHYLYVLDRFKKVLDIYSK